MSVYLNQYRKFNGNMLKVIACITMLIDHVGAAFIYPVYANGVQYGILEFSKVKIIYEAMRFIGRSAFPIFCFLLVEGFIHTSNRLRYALSLFSFAIISELPYDLAFNADKSAFDLNIITSVASNSNSFSNSSNVMFTLFIGFIAMWLIDYVKQHMHLDLINQILGYIAIAMISTFSILLANFIHCDYHGYGISLILIIYYFYKYEPFNIIAGYALLATMPNEINAFPAFVLMILYNKKQGRKLGRLKYLFYAYYPVHLITLYIIRCCLYG